MQCYKCDPNEVGPMACEDPFNTNLTNITTINCGDHGEKTLCVKVMAHSRFNKGEMKFIGRSCSIEGSQTCNKFRDQLREGGATLLSCKTCNTDLCNGATGQSLTYVSTRLSFHQTFQSKHDKPCPQIDQFPPHLQN
ncbi:hypothetical protein B566_EDAN000876 [Ephemera danica]|nr:hypothetical protein B566_EDAN000876 [Ephemera danica]